MLGKNRHRLWYFLGALAAALSGITCTDTTGPGSGPGRSAQLAFLPHFTQAAIRAFQNLEAFGFGVNNVRLRLLHADGSLAKDTTVTLTAGQDTVVIQIDVQLDTPQETFRADIELRDGETVLFSGTQSIAATRGGSAVPPPITVEYSGPGATATTLTLGPSDTAMFAGDSVTFRASAKDQNGQAVANLLLGWSIKDEALGSIDAGGKFKAGALRGSTYVIARLLTDLKDSVKVGVVPRATKAVLISGGGQTATAGTALPQAIVVEAQAADNLPVPGAPLTVQVTGGGGSLGAANVLTDANGRASIALTLGTAAGTNSIQVGGTGLTPLSVSATGVAGVAKAIVADATDSLSDTVRAHVAAALLPAALVKDGSGNPTPGIPVKVFGRGKPGAELTGPGGPADTVTLTTDAQGKVKLTARRLPQVTGRDTVFMVAAGVADTVRFVADVGAGSPHHMVYAAQPPAQVTSFTNFSVVVGLKDQFDNALLSSNKAITLKIKTGTGNPSGTLSSPDSLTEIAVGGVSDFPVRVDLAGTGYVIQAVSAGLPTLETTPFAIQVGPATQLLVHGGTEGQGALKNGEVVIKGRALDAGGNDVNGVPMIFAVQSGGGNVNGQDADTVTASPTGQAIGQVDWHVGSSGTQVVRATMNGITLDFHAFLAETLVVIQQPPATTQSGAVLAQQPIVQLRDLAGNQAKVPGVVLFAQLTGEEFGFVTQQIDTTDANGNATWNHMALAGYVQTAQVHFQLPPCDCAGPPAIKPGKSANVSILTGTAINIEPAYENTMFFLNAPGNVALQIRATDGFNPVPNAGINFARVAGDQYCTMPPSSVVTSDANGIAAMTVGVGGPYASCVVVATMTNPPTPPPCESEECFTPAPPSVTNRLFDAPAGTYIWLGESSPYWLDLFNWNTQIVPTASSTVYIPVAAYSAPVVTGTSPAPPTAKHVYADVGARIETTSSEDQLQVFGDFLVDIVTGAGRVWLAPDGSSFGSLKAAKIEGNLMVGTDGECSEGVTTLVGDVNVGTSGGTTDVDVRCKLNVGKYAFATANDFIVSTSGRLDMSEGDAKVVVGGNASFNGNAYLSAGLLEIKKNFSTSGDCEVRVFRASGTHVTRMISAANDTTYMNSDCFPEFATLEIANTGTAPVAYNSAHNVYSVSAKVVRIAKDAKWSISSNTNFTILAGGLFDVESAGLFRRFGSFFVGSCTISLDEGPDFTGPFSCTGYNPQ